MYTAGRAVYGGAIVAFLNAKRPRQVLVTPGRA